MIAAIPRKLVLLAAIIVTAGFGYAVMLPEVGVEKDKARETFQKGVELASGYHYSASIDYFLESLTHDPDFALARRRLGQSLYFTGQIDEALNEWKILLEQGNYDPSLQLHMQSLRSFHVVPDPKWQYLKTINSERGYRYKFPTFGGTLPDNHIFVLAHDEDGGNLIVLDSNGAYLENFRRLSGRLQTPIAGAFDGETLWITDMAADIVHRVKINFEGVERVGFDVIESFGTRGNDKLEFHGPAGICYNGEHIFIVDQGNDRIQKISPQGEFVQEIRQIRDRQNLSSPFGIACDANQIIITEPDMGRISAFDTFGNFTGYIGEGLFNKPRHVSITEQYILIADEVNGVILIDRLKWKSMTLDRYRTGENIENVFYRPYSSFIDRYGNLYVVDYGGHDIVQFVPEQFIYSNLEVWVERVYAKEFPHVGVWVSVKDQLGNYLTDLTSDNFTIEENGAQVGRLGTSYLKQFENQSRWIVLISKGAAMKNYQDSLNWVSDFFLSNLREKDLVKVLSYHDSVRADSEWTNSRLRIRQGLSSVAQSDLTSDSVTATGQAVYQAIGELLPEVGRRALIWITDGNIRPGSMEDFNLARLENYARNNHIPIFVVSFENPDFPDWKHNREYLREFARKTGGEYYSSQSPAMSEIEEKLRSVVEERYVLNYESNGDVDWKDQYMDIRVNVKFQGRTGMETSGYFIE